MPNNEQKASINHLKELPLPFCMTFILELAVQTIPRLDNRLRWATLCKTIVTKRNKTCLVVFCKLEILVLFCWRYPQYGRNDTNFCSSWLHLTDYIPASLTTSSQTASSILLLTSLIYFNPDPTSLTHKIQNINSWLLHCWSFFFLFVFYRWWQINKSYI